MVAHPNEGVCLMRQILVLDDEPLVAMMVEDWLTELGFVTVGPANSVASALRLADEQKIDAAILDVSLGGENCYQVADLLKQRKIPFAFATGRGAEDVDRRFASVTVMTKPYDFETVKGLLDRLLMVL